MNFEMTDHVPGFGDDEVDAMVDEAEAGYDLSARRAELNPHFQLTQAVPEDLLEAIEERAEREGESPESVVRRALVAYLHSA